MEEVAHNQGAQQRNKLEESSQVLYEESPSPNDEKQKQEYKNSLISAFQTDKSQLAQSDITTEQEWNSVIQRVEKTSQKPAAKIEIAVLGKYDVGKTSLIHKYVDPDSILKVEKIKTHGTDIKSVYISIFGETVSKVNIWDTAGQESHANIVGSYVKKLSACLMIFDLTDANSFQGIRKWIK